MGAVTWLSPQVCSRPHSWCLVVSLAWWPQPLPEALPSVTVVPMLLALFQLMVTVGAPTICIPQSKSSGVCPGLCSLPSVCASQSELICHRVCSAAP